MELELVVGVVALSRFHWIVKALVAIFFVLISSSFCSASICCWSLAWVSSVCALRMMAAVVKPCASGLVVTPLLVTVGVSKLAAVVVVAVVVVRVKPGVTPVGLPVPVLVLPVVLPVLVLPVLASVGVRGVFGVGTIALWATRGFVMVCQFEAVDVVNAVSIWCNAVCRYVVLILCTSMLYSVRT